MNEYHRCEKQKKIVSPAVSAGTADGIATVPTDTSSSIKKEVDLMELQTREKYT